MQLLLLPWRMDGTDRMIQDFVKSLIIALSVIISVMKLTLCSVFVVVCLRGLTKNKNTRIEYEFYHSFD